MNTNNRFFCAKSIISVTFAVIVFAGALLLVSCSKQSAESKPAAVDYYTCTMHPSVHSQDPHGKCPICSMDLVPVEKKSELTNQPPASSLSGDVDYYTCAMHPSVRSHDPRGKCPICGMGLIAVKKNPEIGKPSGETSAAQGELKKEDEAQPFEFIVPVKRQQQIGVTYANVETRPFHHTVRALGTVAYDNQRRWEYVARVDGYVQKMDVFSRGETVEKGAPLLTIYSPEALTAQKEFVNALNMRDSAQDKTNRDVLKSAKQLIASGRERFRLWNIDATQIDELEKKRQPEETLKLSSPFKGVVQDIAAVQGSKVAAGDKLVDIADLTTVWVWAQFSQDELPMAKKGLPVTITTSSYPGEKFEGTISIVDPFVNDALRTGRARIDVQNPDLKLRPDMYVDAELSMDMGEALAVPVSAVLLTGLHNIAFVDGGEGKLKPQFIELGKEYGDFYEVKSGLKLNDRVVASANFLIDAEAQVQGALKSW
ncbi:MAG TPA: efflux RND transporter periplasmic adaptor subunit [Verrucomicrobiae bacterium]|jgi:Cu(I)/Ag(I) efflux system membrane fusion protein